MTSQPDLQALLRSGKLDEAIEHLNGEVKRNPTDIDRRARLAELFECGLLRGSYIPPAELKEVRDLTRYRIKTVQARTSEIQRLGKALESQSAGYKDVFWSGVYPTTKGIADKVRTIRFDYYDKSRPPSSTLLLFEGLPSLDASVAVEVAAVAN